LFAEDGAGAAVNGNGVIGAFWGSIFLIISTLHISATGETKKRRESGQKADFFHTPEKLNFAVGTNTKVINPGHPVFNDLKVQ
jgi:hypothetical protein